MKEIKPCAHGAEQCVLLGGTGRTSVRSDASNESSFHHTAPGANSESCFTLSLPPISRSFAPLPALLRPSCSRRTWGKLTLARFV
jgi:hypothetical protein